MGWKQGRKLGKVRGWEENAKCFESIGCRGMGPVPSHLDWKCTIQICWGRMDTTDNSTNCPLNSLQCWCVRGLCFPQNALWVNDWHWEHYQVPFWQDGESPIGDIIRTHHHHSTCDFLRIICHDRLFLSQFSLFLCSPFRSFPRTSPQSEALPVKSLHQAKSLRLSIPFFSFL